MAITVYLRNTNTHVGTLGSTGNFDLETTTGTTASQSFGANTPRTYVYYSPTTFPNLLTWDTGNYTWNVDVTTANANVQLTSIKISRYDSSLTTERASATGTPNLTLSTTGLKTGTVNFASPNPGGSASSDRLVVTFTFTKLAGGGVQSVSADVNGSGDSRVDTPLTIPTIRDISDTSISVSDSVVTQELYTKPISESSISVSDSVATNELYIKPISDSSVSVSDSVGGTLIPGLTGQLYNVHFYEFPEEISDSVYVPAPTQIEQVSTTKTHKYSVLEKVTKTKTHKYNLIQKVTKSKTHKFHIITRVTLTKTHKYNVIQKITKTKTHKYNVIGKVTVSKTHKYGIAGIVTRTHTHKYNVAGTSTQVSTTKIHVYDILVKVTKSKTHKYHVIIKVTKSKTHKYNLIARIARSATHKFSIKVKVTATRTHKYYVTNKITKTRTHKYHILTKITKSKTHKYHVIAKVTRTHTHKWNEGGRVRLTKRHIFNVGEGRGITEGAGSATVAHVRFAPRVRIVDIISDIRNIAIANVEIFDTQLKPQNIAIGVVELATNDARVPLALRTASSRYNIRVASRLIVPEIQTHIDHKAVSSRLGIEELPLTQDRQFQTRSHISIYQKSAKTLLTSSSLQLRQTKETIISLASSTQITTKQRIASLSNIQIPYNFSRQIIRVSEVMTRDYEQTLRALIDLLKNDDLFQ